ncbi:hypothetical protein [Streptomyces anulatus]|uniref:hypothetical protein n=1 Tax=Streptomyces anulatus TaxID=1892 RepID=UPI0033E61C79
MTLTALFLIMLLFVVTLLVGGGVLALALHRPAWAAPVTAAVAAMMLIATVASMLVAVARS